MALLSPCGTAGGVVGELHCACVTLCLTLCPHSSGLWRRQRCELSSTATCHSVSAYPLSCAHSATWWWSGMHNTYAIMHRKCEQGSEMMRWCLWEVAGCTAISGCLLCCAVHNRRADRTTQKPVASESVAPPAGHAGIGHLPVHLFRPKLEWQHRTAPHTQAA